MGNATGQISILSINMLQYVYNLYVSYVFMCAYVCVHIYLSTYIYINKGGEKWFMLKRKIRETVFKCNR